MTTNREVFDQIAESWYRVRHWPLLKEELEEVAQNWQRTIWRKGTRPSASVQQQGTGQKLLNIGCAHGPDFLPFSQGFELWGVDASAAMLRQALRYCAKFKFYANLIAADALSLPFQDNTFDWVISVATYHHIKGGHEREMALRELRRVLKPGGEAFLTVWNHGQPRFWLKSKEQDIVWRLRGESVYRYYHLFSYREFKRLLMQVGFKILAMSPEKSFHFPIKDFSRNICVQVKK
jgi:tRNA (uracil-5-)-methyltransferase TRM9